MTRIQSPIILRKVQGTYASYRFYASDPILIRPCVEVRYIFHACDPSPRLEVYSQTGTSGNLAQTSILGYIFSDKPSCMWNRQQYENDPDAYEQSINSNVYAFGNFATVSPGGTYQAETRTICDHPDMGTPASYQYSLAEGCDGGKCPPSEVVVKIEANDAIPAGSYSLRIQSLDCGLGYTGSACGYFAGIRATYIGQFLNDEVRYTFSVYRQSVSGGFPNSGWYASDDCGCESRVLSLFIVFQSAYSGGSSNAARFPTGNRCFPICSDGSTEAVFENYTLQVGSGGVNLGRVTVKF